MVRLVASVAAVLVAVSAVAVHGQEITGKVVGVTDGDTVKVLVDRKTVTVRLEGIDAPESGQSFGRKAKDALAALVAGKEVRVEQTGTDQYGRALGTIFVGDVDVNAKLVEQGWAWHFKKYSSDIRLAKLEIDARDAKRGLWAEAKPLPPWEFRARQRAPVAEPSEDPGANVAHWLNTSSGVRHNRRCQYFNNTKRGRYCGADEGRACGICGG